MKRFLQPIIENRSLLYSLIGVELLQGVLIIAAAYVTAWIVDGVFLGGMGLNETLPMLFFLLLAMLLNSLAGAIKQRRINGISLDFRNAIRLRLHSFIAGKALINGIAEADSGSQGIIKNTKYPMSNVSLADNNINLAGLERITSPKLLTLMVETVDKLDDFYKNVLPLVFSLVVRVILFLMVMLYADTITGLIFLFTLPIAPALLMLIGRLTKNASIRQWQKLSELNIGFSELLNGIPTAKIYGRTENESSILRVLSSGFTESTMKVLRLAFASAFAIELITTLSIALIAVGIGFRLIDAHMVFKTAFFALLMAPEFYQPLRLAGTAFHSGIEAHTALQEIISFINIKKVVNRQNSHELRDINRNEFDERDKCNKYDGYPYSLLPGFYSSKIIEQLQPEKHRLTAITGPSGCGKSTLLMFLAGLYPSELNLQGKGCSVAYVPQEPHIFAASLWDNVTLFKEISASPDYTLYKGTHLNEEGIYILLKRVALDEWYQHLPNGMETIIGAKGAPLSNGQRHRLGLVRALLQQLDILLLDETTAGLEEPLEARLLVMLKEYAAHHTVIIVSHRRQVLEAADVVIKLGV